MKKPKSILGFTLIELLIVIAIIGVLAVAFLPSLLGAPAKSRDAQRQTAVQKLQTFVVSQTAGRGLAVLPGGASPNAVNSECILGASGTAQGTNFSSLIFNNINAFGGVFPADPQPQNVFGTANTACSGYLFVRYPAGSNFDVGVFARAENFETANSDCNNILNLGALTVTQPGQQTALAGNTNQNRWCYGALLDL